MADPAAAYYARQEKLVEIAKYLAQEDSDWLAGRIVVNAYELRDLTDALTMIENDKVLSLEKAKAVAVAVVTTVIRRAEERMALHASTAKNLETHLHAVLRPFLAELQADHNSIL